MTDTNRDLDALDRVAEAIRRDDLDDATVEAATDRVWQRLARGLEQPLRQCADYQRLIPDLVAGRLPEGRALLVADHTRECLACRRVLMEARGSHAAPSIPAAQQRRRMPRWLRLAAAAVVAAGLGLVGFLAVGNMVVDSRLTATVVTPDGALQRVAHDSIEPLDRGAVVAARQVLRTASEAPAELRLADGSVVEIAPRSEIELSAALRGTTVRLTRGNVIVHAAKQHGGRLFVATDDCLVAVRGTIFAVDHGLKGSRVSVIEGEVEVRRQGRTDLLEPGEQLTTRAALETVRIEDQIAWSPNAAEHAALLRELASLKRDVADAIEPRTPRTSSRLLELAGRDTVVYIALPNLTEGLGEARTIIEQRVASSPVLQAWWQEHVVAAGIDREVDAMLDRLQPLGDAVGDEVVVTLSEATLDGAGPVLLARLDDPISFSALLREQVERVNRAAGTPVIELVEDPQDASPSSVELVMAVSGDLFVAASNRSQLVEALQTAAAGDAPFLSTELGQRLRETYGGGVSWVAGVDLRTLMARAATRASDDGSEMMERLGLLDATILVASSRRDGDRRSLGAELDFAGARRGVAAWLAEPAPIGSLDFVSPAASFAAAAVSKDAGEMLDELLAALAAQDPETMEGLVAIEQLLGIDLRGDLAAPLGGEGAFAVDGPVLPSPSWKLILEVYDPETLFATLDRVVAEVNRGLAAHGRPPIELVEVQVGGHDYHVLRHASRPGQIAMLAIDGYLVVAPGTALVEQALQLRRSGVTLPRSAAFQELLPTNGFTDCSAVVWRNLDSLLATLPDAALDQLPPELHALLEEGGGPGLICAWGLGDRIVASGSGGSLLGGVPLLGLGGVLRAPHSTGRPEPVSSAG